MAGNMSTIGLIGLGNMGGPLARNRAAAAVAVPKR